MAQIVSSAPCRAVEPAEIGPEVELEQLASLEARWLEWSRVMLQIIQRWLGLLQSQSTGEATADTTVLLVRVPVHPAASPLASVDARSSVDSSIPAADVGASSILPAAVRQVSLPPAAADAVYPAVAGEKCGRTSPSPQRPLTKPGQAALKTLAILPPGVLVKLRRVGVHTAADLLAADPERLVEQIGAANRWAGKIRRSQRAIRFAGSYSDMAPLEALMLFAAHRRSRWRLADESAAVLKRDLDRLLLSTIGQKLAAGRPAPEIARVRQWIVEARNSDRKLLNRLPRGQNSPSAVDGAKSVVVGGFPTLSN